MKLSFIEKEILKNLAKEKELFEFDNLLAKA